MPEPTGREEIEIKLRVADLRATQARLKRLGAREIVPRTYELNTLFDTPRQSLRRRGRIIRVRVEQLAARNGTAKNPSRHPRSAILTYKAKTENSTAVGATAVWARQHGKWRTVSYQVG